MSAGYSASGDQTLTTTATTALTVGSNATTGQRNKFREFWMGNVGTPADLASIQVVRRCTALGTGTLVTATEIDPADRAAQAAAAENHTVEPTYTSAKELLEIPLNHRGTYRWVAAPGMEIITPATVANGIGFTSLHASAVTDWRVGALWTE